MKPTSPAGARSTCCWPRGADELGLLRRGGLAFFFPGRGTAVLNVIHIEAPLDPVLASQAQFDGRDQADMVIALLRAEFPKAFGAARVRAYGYPGRRQTRWIKGRHQLTADQVRHGTWFEDAVARTAWPIELHDRSDGYVWETFGPDHVHYVPLRAMTPPGAHNLVAAGRCVDGDAAALSSVRVMGPCAAMGAGAAHALDLAGRGSVHDIDLDRLRGRLAANLDSGKAAAERRPRCCRRPRPRTWRCRTAGISRARLPPLARGRRRATVPVMPAPRPRPAASPPAKSRAASALLLRAASRPRAGPAPGRCARTCPRSAGRWTSLPTAW